MESLSERLDLMPHFLGDLFYPMGAPIQADNCHFESVSLNDMKAKYYDSILNKKPAEALTDMQIKFLRQYIEYFIHAPLFELGNVQFEGFLNPLYEWIEKQPSSLKTIHKILHKCMDYGIDPF